MHGEYRSRHRCWGLPILHVAWGTDPFTGRTRVARGLVAVGPVALGAVAVGPIAVGLVAIGQVTAGLFLGVGQLAVATVAVGQIALGGAYALGQLAAGYTAEGGVAVSEVQLPVTLAWLCIAAVIATSWWRVGRRLLGLLGPATTIGSVRPGLTVLAGRIRPLRMVAAPVSQRACVAYDVRRVRNDRPTKSEHRGEDFVVVDGSGYAHVVVRDAVFMLEPIQGVVRAVERRIVAHEIGGPGSGIVRAMGTAIERVLMPGDDVVVCGHALSTCRGNGSPPRLAVQGGGAGPVLVTNRNPAEIRAEVQLLLSLAILFAVAALLVPIFIAP